MAFEHMTDADIEAAIAEITEAMKGPMSNLDRAWNHADRGDLRTELAARKARTTPATSLEKPTNG